MLTDTPATETERRWLKDSKSAIESINAFIDRHGLLSSRLRYRPDRDHRPGGSSRC
jgi:post-segregation antitoxin (ccd killing protein)